ncbi:FHA domain-containing protein [Streptomyces sp. NPDC002845]
MTDDNVPRRYVDKGLAYDDSFGEEIDETDGDSTQPAPPPWTEPPPPSSRPCWSCGSPVPSGSPGCPECQEPTRHVRLISPEPSIDLRHGAGPPLRLGRHPVWAPAVAAALSGERGKGVSRRHASVEMALDGAVWLEEHADGTMNGTYVNGERIGRGARVPLNDGDVVRLGQTCAFKVLLVGPGS